MGSLIGVLLAVGLGCVLMLEELSTIGEKLGRRLRELSYDTLYASRKVHPTRPPEEAVVVYLDDFSHEKLEQRYDAPWDRNYHARLLERLKADGAKSVVFDIVFNEPGRDQAADAHFAKAIKDFGKVILAADWVAPSGGAVGSKTVLPHEPFLEAAANVGVAEMAPGSDFFVREHFPGAPDELVSSLSWAAAESLGAPIATNAAAKFKSRWINYYAPPGGLANLSFYQAISADPNEAPKPGFFKDKIVFVGSRVVTQYSGQRKDEYWSPYSIWTSGDEKSKNFMSGVEVQATVCLNLLRSDWLTKVPFITEFWLVLLTGLIFGFVLPVLRPFFTFFVAVVSIVVISYAAFYLFSEKLIWFNWLMLVAVQIPTAAIWAIVFNSVQIYVQKRLMEQSLGMYVSPSRVKQIMKRPEILKPGAEKQDVSILFSDIANFTSMSEGMDSDQLANLMNSYFETTVGECIHPAQGTVIKFIGDAIFAIWNAPEVQSNHQELACRGALALRDSSSKFNFGKGMEGLEIRTRIGLHCGVANVGNFGSSTRIDYTALGENINLAARMEGLNKYLGTDVLVTGEVHKAVEGKFISRFCGDFRLKGFEKAVAVYDLLALPDQAEPSRIWREAYAEALKRFQQKHLDEAEAAFQGVIQLRGKDGPSQFLIKHIHDLREHPPEGDWTGIVELKEK